MAKSKAAKPTNKQPTKLAKTKRQEFELLNADFDIHIADFLGKHCKCYFSPLWYRAD